MWPRGLPPTADESPPLNDVYVWGTLRSAARADSYALLAVPGQEGELWLAVLVEEPGQDAALVGVAWWMGQDLVDNLSLDSGVIPSEAMEVTSVAGGETPLMLRFLEIVQPTLSNVRVVNWQQVELTVATEHRFSEDDPEALPLSAGLAAAFAGSYRREPTPDYATAGDGEPPVGLIDPDAAPAPALVPLAESPAPGARTSRGAGRGKFLPSGADGAAGRGTRAKAKADAAAPRPSPAEVPDLGAGLKAINDNIAALGRRVEALAGPPGDLSSQAPCTHANDTQTIYM